MTIINSRKASNNTSTPQDVQEVVQIVTDVATIWMGHPSAMFIIEGCMSTLEVTDMVEGYNCSTTSMGEISVLFEVSSDPVNTYALLLMPVTAQQLAQLQAAGQIGSNGQIMPGQP